MQIVRTLMEGIVDYAGLFPPAQLDMATTVRTYAQHLRGEHAAMLGRIVIPAARLDEFEEAAALLLPDTEERPAWRISALTAAAGDPALEDDLERIHIFNECHADHAMGAAVIDAVELKAASARAIDDALSTLTEGLFAAFELPLSGDPRGLIAALAGSPAAAKVRTGGMSDDQFPPTPLLAKFIMACAQGGVPFKATAGLHHPLRHFNDAQQVTMHGFLNVFLAAAYVWANRMGVEDVEALLEEESFDAFAFTEGSVSWREQRIEVEKLADARRRFALSFGSCSFDEPVDDLRRKLALL